jgi:putative MATE family efflux protein
MTTSAPATADPPRRGFAATLDLAAPDVRRTIVRLAFPTVAGLSINALHHTVNAVFVGMIGAHAMAAITVVFPLLIVVAAVGEGLGVGAATTIGRLIGKGALGRASVTASTVLALAVPIGVAMTVLILLLRRRLLVLFGATTETSPMAESYLGIMAFGAALTLLQIISDFVAIAEGNTRFSMWMLIGGFTLNIVLDPILIFGFDLGVAGAAFATILSQLAVLAAYAAYFQGRQGQVRIAARLAHVRLRILLPVFTMGLPTTLASIVTSVAFALVYRQAGAFGGDAAIAGLGIALRLLTLGSLPLLGFTLGAQPAISFAWGAGNHDRVLAAIRFTLLATSAFAIAYGLAMMLFAASIARLFTTDLAVQMPAVDAIVAIHAAFLLIAPRMVVLVLLQAMGQARRAALVSLAPQGYLLIPLLVVLPPWFGLDGIVASLVVAAALTSVLAIALLIPILRDLRLGRMASLASQAT